jgi:hypothetical protein
VPRSPLRPLAWAALAAIHVLLAASFLGGRAGGADAARAGFPLDDAWIHMVYGRELARHGVAAYNPGAAEAGFTSPLWLLAAAAADLAGRATGCPPALALKAVGVLAAAGASVLVLELGFALGGSFAAAFGCAALAAAEPRVAFSQVSGMETGLAAALLLASILALERGRPWSAGVVAALAYLARPECVLLSPLLLAALALAGAPGRGLARAAARAAAQAGLPLLAAAGAWALFCQRAGGRLLPNTFYAKFGPAELLPGFLAIAGGIVRPMPLWFLGGGVALAAAGLASALRKRRPAGVLAAAFPWVFFLGVAASRSMPPESGTYFYWWRYAMPAVPLLFVPVAAGASRLLAAVGAGLRGARGPGPVRGAAVCVGTLALGLALVRYPGQLREQRERYAWNCRNIEEMQVAAGRWVRASVNPGAAVLVSDAGAIRYFGERRCVDLLGLNSHALLFQRALMQRLRWDPATMVLTMRAQGATHLVILPSFFSDLVANPAFARHFEAQASFHSDRYTVAGYPQDTVTAYRLRD